MDMRMIDTAIRADRVTLVQGDGTRIELTPRDARALAFRLLATALEVDRNNTQRAPVAQVGGRRR
jgi:hypothetical protein